MSRVSVCIVLAIAVLSGGCSSPSKGEAHLTSEEEVELTRSKAAIAGPHPSVRLNVDGAVRVEQERRAAVEPLLGLIDAKPCAKSGGETVRQHARSAASWLETSGLLEEAEDIRSALRRAKAC